MLATAEKARETTGFRCTCGARHLADPTTTVYSRLGRFDPTRTTALRNAFAARMRKVFSDLCTAIRRAIVDQDCFGLQAGRPATLASADMSIPDHRAFAFTRSADKVEAFMSWLEEQVQRGILKIGSIRQVGEAVEGAWTDTYVLDSYKRGVLRARYELRKAGYAVPTIDQTGGIDASLSAPFHADRLGVLYTRVFQELKGITAQMDTQISRVLAQGIADGDHPRVLARKLTSTITGPAGDLGITDTLGRFIPAKRRAEMLARTEVIRAHHHGQLQEYRNWAVEGVAVQAEWVTAGYDVCPICAELQGKVYELDEVEKLIPRHPQCRCTVVPVRKRKQSKSVVSSPVEHKPGSSAAFREEVDRWYGKLPRNVRKLLQEADVRIVTGEFLTEANPSLVGAPRGWSPGSTWDMVGGAFDPRINLVGLGEKRKSLGGMDFPYPRQGMFYHEIGHALDFAYRGKYKKGLISSTSEFRKAYLQDAHALNEHQQAAYRYFLQAGGRGEKETFAETFAILVGGASASPTVNADEFLGSFPNVAKHIEELLRRLE